MYAAGKIPGSFFKREGRAGEKGTLTARMIDRPIRPLFPKGWHFETQLVAIPLSVDHVNPYDILAMNGASAALMISEIPLPTPVGAVRIGKVDGNFVVNPDEADLVGETDLDLDRGRHRRGDPHGRGRAPTRSPRPRSSTRSTSRTTRSTSSAPPSASSPRRSASRSSQVEAAGRSTRPRRPDPREPRRAARRGHAGRGQARAPGRHQGRRGGRARAVLGRSRGRHLRRVPPAARSSPSTSSRRRSSASGSPSTRSVPTAAPRTRSATISIEVGVAPRTHGSALFTRGQTQALSVAALGTLKEEMRLDTLGLETQKFYWHHYNFPPFSVGEAGFMRGPKRRDIGHGALAERALVPMVPSTEDFPYTIRVVSDILESNGSSSMASVCGSSLALMDAGVPIRQAGRGHRDGPHQGGRRLHRPDRHRRRRGPPRRHGLQGRRHRRRASPPCRWTSRSPASPSTSCATRSRRPARRACRSSARCATRSPGPRETLSPHAPRIITIQIDPDKIGLLIGKGGETIRGLQDEFDVPDRRQRRGPGARLLVQRRARRGAGRAHPLDDQGGRGRRRVHRQGRQDDDLRRLRRAGQGHRRPAAHLQRRRPGQRRRRRSRTSSTRATRSPSAWSRSTASAAASACASPRTPTIAGKSVEELAAVGASGGGDRGAPRRPRPRPRPRRATASATAAARAARAARVTARAPGATRSVADEHPPSRRMSSRAVEHGHP